MKIKKSLLVSLIAIIALAFWGCGEKSDPACTPYAGTWTATECEVMGVPLDPADLFDGIPVMTLEDNHTGKITIGDVTDKLTWDIAENGISMECEDAELTAVLSDGKLIFETFLGQAMKIVFASQDAAVTTQTDSAVVSEANETQTFTKDESAENQTVFQKYWNGDWYGWWIIDTGFGSYSGMDDGTYWYDCCATIQIDENGNGTIDLWDEDGSRTDLMAYADISVGDGTTDDGCLMSESGMFYDCEVEHADWIVDPGASDVSDNDHMICIDGVYTDPANEDDCFYYYIYLRPWGMEWDDVEEVNLPYSYDSWYLPCIQNGAAMPDAIGGDSETYTANSDSSTAATDAEEDEGDGGMGISIGIHGDGDAPDDAPAGGDGITSLDFTGLKAKADALYAQYSYEEQKQLTYADIVDWMDGVEGEYEDDGLADYWSYNWYGTDGTHWNVKFDAETGLFYTSTLYEF